jgi:transcriptional regulator with XRE-family HTH domain
VEDFKKTLLEYMETANIGGEKMKRNWLIQFRKSKQYTQEQVASAAFIDRGYYSQIETGKRNPGLNVANNIAKVLHFDPLKFFQDHLQDQDHSKKLIISELLKQTFPDNILYLYNDQEKYFDNLFAFLMINIELGFKCLILENENNFNQIQNRLQAELTREQINKYIVIFKHEDLIHLNLKDRLHILDSRIRSDVVLPLRVWLHEQKSNTYEWLEKLEKFLYSKDMKLTKEDIQFLRSFNASEISAVDHIKMMRVTPYLMTDFEIVNSPLFHSSTTSYIFPSLFIQEDI